MTGAGAAKKAKGTAAAVPDMKPAELMKGMGGNGWFNPGSNHQVAWPMLAERYEETVPRALYPMHSWMMVHTTTQGHRHPFANNGGLELHLEHMSAALGIDMHTLRMYWRLGVKLGLWRFGTEEEGTRRLYLCAVIAPVVEPDPSDQEDGDENPTKKDLYKSPFEAFRRLSPYLRTELEKQPLEVQERTAIKLERIAAVEKLAHADVVAALRMVTTQEQDIVWSEIGIEKKRYNGEKKDQAPEEAAAAAERQGRIDKLLPHVQGFVQILNGVVHIEKPTLYTSDSEGVQNPGEKPLRPPKNGNSNQNGGVAGNGETPDTLSALESTKKKKESISRHDLSTDADVRVPSKPLPTKGRSSYTRPEPAAEPEPPRKIDEETRAALRALAEQIESMQTAYKHTDFGLSDFDPISKSGQLFLLRVLNTIGGPVHVMPFALNVAAKFKGLDRHAMGKLPARAPGQASGPRGLGLILEWAKDYRGRGGRTSAMGGQS